ncbi:MAG: L,D-transpeptidase family protein [Succinivibrionaceae bacterium]
MRILKAVACMFVFASLPAASVDYQLNPGQRLVGQNFNYTMPEGKHSLEYVAALTNLGLSNVMEANPWIDPYLPEPGTVMLIPHQLILPNTLQEGIVINTAEMRLYYYPKDTDLVVVLPIGIGQLGKDTPVGWVTKVERKKAGPTWTPTAKVRAEYAAEGKSLPAVVPAGKDNPMGLYALYVGRLYAIHGTNAKFGIGLRVSHGCIRLRDDDIKWLFENVPVNTRVEFINEPIKATVEPDGSKYLEVHQPLSSTFSELTSKREVPFKTIPDDVLEIIQSDDVDQSIVQKVFAERKGIPVKINGFSF